MGVSRWRLGRAGWRLANPNTFKVIGLVPEVRLVVETVCNLSFQICCSTLDDTDTESAKDAMLQADSDLEMSQNIAKTLVSYFKFYNKKVSTVFLIIFFFT